MGRTFKEEIEARENILAGRRGKHKRFIHSFKFNKLFSSAYYASGTFLGTFHILKDLILVTTQVQSLFYR